MNIASIEIDSFSSESDTSFGSQVEITDWLAETSPPASSSSSSPSPSRRRCSNVGFKARLFDGDSDGDGDYDGNDKENSQRGSSQHKHSSGPGRHSSSGAGGKSKGNSKGGNGKKKVALSSDRSFSSSSSSNIRLVVVPDSAYIRLHLDEFSALCEVDDLDFAARPVQEQEDILRSMSILELQPGELVFDMGDTSSHWYIVVASQDTCATAHVEVVREGKVLTHLYRGQYFGQMQFLTRQRRARNAAIRVPASLDCSSVKIARISAPHFELWAFFRTMLIVRAVPFLSALPRANRQELLSLTDISHYADGEAIVRQGGEGDRFFIILDGAARVVEDAPAPPGGAQAQTQGNAKGAELALIRSGHCFGEMALVTNEPRVANVLSAGATTCLSLTKDAFKKELGASSDAFSQVMTNLLQKRERTRRHRSIVRRPLRRGDWSQIHHLSASEDTCSLSSSVSYSELPLSTSGAAPALTVAFKDSASADGSSTVAVDYSSSKQCDGDGGEELELARISVSATPTPNKTRMSISDNAVLSSLLPSTPLASQPLPQAQHTTSRGAHALTHTPARRTLSEPLDAPVTETKTFSVSKLSTGDRCVNGKYLLEKEIGTGSFGDVYQIKDLHSNRRYAMKRLNRALIPRTPISPGVDVMGEMEIMKRLRNHYIVRLHEVIDDPSAKRLYLIQDLMEGPLLPDALQCEPFCVEDCRRYFRDIVRGVHYLHSMGVIHRDIKPQNILVSKGRAKIGDLGAAVFTGGHERSTFHGTPAYTAPELNIPHEQRSHSFSCMPCIDLFAMGATLFSMATGHPPWMADTELGLADKIRHLEPRMPTDVDPHLRYLLLRLLDKDWQVRADMDNVVGDAWVTDEDSDPLFDDYHEEEGWDSLSSLEHRVGVQGVGANTTTTAGGCLGLDALPLRVGTEAAAAAVPATKGESEAEAEAEAEAKDDDAEDPAETETPLTQDFDCTTAFQRGSARPKLAFLTAEQQQKQEESQQSQLASQALVVSPSPFSSLVGAARIAVTVPPPTLAARSAAVVQRKQRRMQSLQQSRLLSRLSGSGGSDDSDQIYIQPGQEQEPVNIVFSELLDTISRSRAASTKINTNANCASASPTSASASLQNVNVGWIQCCDSHSDVDDDGDDDGDDDKSAGNTSDLSRESGSGSDDDEDYGETTGVQGLDVFDTLQLQLEAAGQGEDRVWNCFVKRDGSIEPADEQRGCVSPLPAIRGRLSSPNATSDALACLRSEAPGCCKALQLRVASGRAQGGRPTMEDRTCVQLAPVANPQQRFSNNALRLRSPAPTGACNALPATVTSTAIVGVFDGHDGSYVSEQLSRDSPAMLRTALAAGMSKVAALRHTCAELDRRVLSRDHRRLQAQKRHGGLSAQTFGGSTGLLMIVDNGGGGDNDTGSRSDKTNSNTAGLTLTLTLANVGDCRAVLSSQGRCKHLTIDHKATLPSERARIERAGGSISNGRVNGVLAISRSFGDVQFKTVEPRLFKQEITDPEQWWGGAAQAVTSEPEIVSISISSRDEFLLLATDGLWDHFSGEEAVNFVRFRLLEHADCDKAVQQLLDETAARATRGSHGGASWDNVSVVLCALNQTSGSFS